MRNVADEDSHRVTSPRVDTQRLGHTDRCDAFLLAYLDRVELVSQGVAIVLVFLVDPMSSPLRMNRKLLSVKVE